MGAGSWPVNKGTEEESTNHDLADLEVSVGWWFSFSVHQSAAGP